MIIRRTARAQRWNEKKGQSREDYVSPIWGEAPTQATYTSKIA